MVNITSNNPNSSWYNFTAPNMPTIVIIDND
jgi:hypothetical protein